MTANDNDQESQIESELTTTPGGATTADGLDEHFNHAGLILLGAVAAIFMLTFRDYGYSWDELWQNRWYGQAILNFIKTFGEDQSSMTTQNFYLYGGLYDTIAEIIPYISPFDGFESRRLANASIGFLALLGTWKTARMLSGPQAGFWALLLLVVTPAYYGHIFINAKDIPFATGYIWSLYYILKVHRGLPEIPWKTAIGLGVAFGLSVGVRVAGSLVIVYFFMVIGAYLVGLLLDVDSPHSLRTVRKGMLLQIITALIVAWFLMIIFWPAVMLYPMTGLVEAFQSTKNFKGWNGSILYNGEYVKAVMLPWHYLPVYFGVKLPVPVLLAFITGIGWSFYRIIQSLRKMEVMAVMGPGLLLFATLFPPIYAILLGSTLYDGIRHFLFIIPPMACLAGMALAELLPMVKQRLKHSGLVLLSGLLIYLVFHVWTMIQLHPYQYSYLNSIAGGMPAAAKKYETEYWITSYKEAATKMVKYAREYAQLEGVPFENRRFTVAVYGNAHNVRAVVPANFTVIDVSVAKRADFYLSTTRFNSDKLLPKWRIIERVERMGMLFAVVKTALKPLAGSGK